MLVFVQRMHVPPHTLGMLKPVFKKLADANRSRSVTCALLSSATDEAADAATQATMHGAAGPSRPPVARPATL